MKNFIHINSRDSVAVAVKHLNTDTKFLINNKKIQLLQDIDKGHKFAVEDISKGQDIIKYGMSIGTASQDISVGSHVHTHNMKTKLDSVREYFYEPEFRETVVNLPCRNIMAYRRGNGNVGIRNELWIVPTVGCVNAVGSRMIQCFKEEAGPLDIDGIHIFTHDYGCSQMGEDHENTVKILRNIVLHPNAGGVLILGLGCENNQVSSFLKKLGNYNSNRIKTLVIQEVDDEIESGVAILRDIYFEMKDDLRESVSISELKVGLKCGGSDGLSGVTANPLLGKFSDYLVQCGGTTVLTEVPEMFGAETLLMKRAVDKNTFDKTVRLINDFKKYFEKYGQVVYENPSPGNKEGGITTLEDKSLGCVQKAGESKVMDVLIYGEVLTSNGLNLLSGPGNDMVASTALGAAGCHMVLFSTGRGTPYGSFIPTVKISSNSELAEKKKNWIDFNAGSLLNELSMDNLLEQFIDYIIKVANGEETKNEINDFREISIFKTGVTL